MKRTLPFGVVLAVLFLAGPPAAACTVFFVFAGKLALAGDNEDWADPNTQMYP